MASIKMVMAISLITLLLSHNNVVHSQSIDCKSMTFSNNKTYANCMNLPTLNSILHWTYNAPTSTLSMAFIAPSKGGWVAWGLNPKGSGMVGAQVLMAYKPNPNEPTHVNKLDIQSYHTMQFGPISYDVTDVSCEDLSGNVTIFGTWVIPSGETVARTVWQVGPINNKGLPEVHEMETENLSSKLDVNVSDNMGQTQTNSSYGLASPPWTVDAATIQSGLARTVASFVPLLGSLSVFLLF